MPDTLETVGQDLDEARARIVATREALQAVLDRRIEVPEFQAAVDRLARIEAELARVDGLVAGVAGRAMAHAK